MLDRSKDAIWRCPDCGRLLEGLYTYVRNLCLTEIWRDVMGRSVSKEEFFNFYSYP